MEYWTWDTDEFYNSGQIPLIIEDLAAVGIMVEVSQHSVAESRDHIRSPGHNSLFAGNWYADFPDADNFFYMFFHTGSRSIWGMNYKSPEIDAQIDEARRTNDIEQRTKIYQELNRMSMEEAPMVYLFHDRFFLAHKPEVRGVRTYLVPPPVRFHDVWIEK
jgi:ABC-type transport system substrate-binding protein